VLVALIAVWNSIARWFRGFSSIRTQRRCRQYWSTRGTGRQ
jgi:hypothetical protein